ncbi:hypothetical protein SESBI_49724 [Sesbania bispinosa]|nr:hypothetical protein SESBI_49724 [Sesbania bispinosa]
MAPNQQPTFPLRFLVDKDKNRIVMAEVSANVMNILFSFLTLPLGTIIQLLSKLQDKQKEIGCINNLYQSVKNCSDQVFWNQICQRMLLYPRNPCEALCQKLKLKVDDSEPTKYFMCSTCLWSNGWLLSTFAGARCSCGKLMDKEMKLHGDSGEETHGDGVFVKDGTRYLIFDDLKVLQSTPGNSIQKLLQLGYKNINKLSDKSQRLDLNKILNILNQALTSKTPLSHALLENGESKQKYTFSPKHGPKNKNWIYKLNITVRKSQKKILYAEAEGEFVDFLFSFLTTPLGSIIKLLNGNSSLGCVDNLYNSVKGLNPSWFTGSSGTPLLDPQVAPQFGCWKQPLKLNEEATPSYWYGTGVIKNNIGYSNGNGVISKKKSLISNPNAMKLFEPRSPDGTKEISMGFVRRPSLFVVWDDLKVTPLANNSSIEFVQKLNVPLDDLEEHVVSIGETEALNLLGASLTSNSKAALTEGLFYLLNKPKEEIKA